MQIILCLLSQKSKENTFGLFIQTLLKLGRMNYILLLEEENIGEDKIEKIINAKNIKRGKKI
jgi:hypothetical protein